MIAEKLEPVTRSRAQRFFLLTVFLLLLLALGGYLRLRRSPIDGTWVKLEGMTDELPDEMTVRLTNAHHNEVLGRRGGGTDYDATGREGAPVKENTWSQHD